VQPGREALTKFGIQLEDEGRHPFDPEVEWWNESWFWDWFDATGELAGHCRIGIHPNQGRAWLWLYLFRAGEWIALEEPRLPLADLAPATLAYDRWGLRFSWEPKEPLRAGRLRVEGFGRVVAGPRTGMILPVGVDLVIGALGPPHSQGRAHAPGHASERYAANRFEQPIGARGSLSIAGEEHAFVGRGERDHSWGPRAWNLEWTFLVLNGEDLRLQCSEAFVSGAGRFAGGYLQRGETVSLAEVRFDLRFDLASVLAPFEGRFSAQAPDGSRVAAELEVISAAEIDLTHTFVPPQRSVYRRALLRAHRDDGPPLLGWLEFNRFLEKKPEGAR
jgi:hypothetical protein